MKYYRWTNI